MERIRAFRTLFPRGPTDSEELQTPAHTQMTTDKTGWGMKGKSDGQKAKPDPHRHNEWKMLPVRTQKTDQWGGHWFTFIFGSAFSSMSGFGTVETSATLALLQECDYVWKYENTVTTEQKDQLLFTLCTDWIYSHLVQTCPGRCGVMGFGVTISYGMSFCHLSLYGP